MRKVDFRFDPPKCSPRQLTHEVFARECAAAGMEPRNSVGAMTLDDSWMGLPKGAPVLVVVGTNGGSVYASESSAGDVLTLRDPNTGLPAALAPSNDGAVIITIERGGVELRRHTTTGDTALDLAWALDELRQRGGSNGDDVTIYEGDLTALLQAQTEADELRASNVELSKALAECKAQLAAAHSMGVPA